MRWMGMRGRKEVVEDARGRMEMVKGGVEVRAERMEGPRLPDAWERDGIQSEDGKVVDASYADDDYILEGLRHCEVFTLSQIRS